MWTILLIIFVVCLVSDYVQEGGSFIFFSRFVEFSNSFRTPTPRKALIARGTMSVEYKFGNRLFFLVVPFPEAPQGWKQVGTRVGNEWVDVTEDIVRVAGPAKDFCGIPLKPEHINENFDVLAFAYSQEKVILVKKGEVILEKLREVPK